MSNETTISDDMGSMKNSAIIIKNMCQNVNLERKKLIEWFEDSAFNDQMELILALTKLAYESYDVIHNRLEDKYAGGYFDSPTDEQQNEIDASDKIRDRLSEIHDQIDCLSKDTSEVK